MEQAAVSGNDPDTVFAGGISNMVESLFNGTLLAKLAEHNPGIKRLDFMDPDAADAGIIENIRFAFYETPVVFRIELGDPGSHPRDRVVAWLKIEEWVWKLSEIRLPH